MLKRSLVVAAVTVTGILFTIPAAQADSIITLTATTQSPIAVSSFTITYDDVDGDNLLSLPEVSQFSGVIFFLNQSYSTILTVPAIAGVADGTGSTWLFTIPGTGNIISIPSSDWTYRQTTSAVPGPV